ncbi:LPXTG cell wall anchor domain-containing protein [Enterococcus thailandicus]|uniref:LPXTG cell wall anchor domain-containing protein n=1 Tax=Enterococcus thailandicus TaxID=417368 RepID=UPI0022EBC2C2|nr:LPXTG cell wall anchor domain-containing protein [Enterococcus thailandicus]MDA3973168.1 LPXTG cell wall anchor domain-containing protein [Enterococcus thailandicus]MDA3975398.1 LPXTG cell wall anchor domain-containing protein [Enterococcus thailandicus]MDA3980628.1 LPXTG cell wall anchor domain-containing protein [Enterococcus thailandicus]
MKKRIIQSLIMVLGLLAFSSLNVFASEQTNFDMDEQQVTFRIINEQNEQVDGAGENNSHSLLPKTNETSIFVLSFVGALFIGLAFLIFWWRRRRDENEETN